MACPQSYHPTTILANLGYLLSQHDSNMRVQLSSNNVTCEEALSAVLGCVAGLPVRTCLATTDTLEREALRREAHFLKTIPHSRILDKENNTNAEENSALPGLPIRSNLELKPTDMPKPITPEERAILKKQALEMNLPPYPYPHLLPGKGKDGRLPDGTEDVK